MLFHFDAIFMKFHGQLSFLVQPKMGAMAHAKIKVFSAYRAGYTRKIPSNLCTYAVVLKTVVYEAVHKVFFNNLMGKFAISCAGWS